MTIEDAQVQPKEKSEPKKLTTAQKLKALFKFFTFQWESEQTETKPQSETQKDLENEGEELDNEDEWVTDEGL